MFWSTLYSITLMGKESKLNDEILPKPFRFQFEIHQIFFTFNKHFKTEKKPWQKFIITVQDLVFYHKK